MTDEPPRSPGTVSKILWHFTGGPIWKSDAKRQSDEPKRPAEAYKNLCSILKTRQLRLGSYQEVAKIMLPRRRELDPKTGKYVVRENVPAEIVSSPVCCLSDIPAAHLGYHAYRYGRFAVGFHRASAVNHGFNPVLYSLETTGVIRSIYDGFVWLEGIDTSFMTDLSSSINDLVGETDDDALISDVDSNVSDLDAIATDIEGTVSAARESLQEFVAFVKTFREDEFSTIYCEREWRALKAFDFNNEDVAMITLPRKVGGTEYFESFVSDIAPQLKLPRSIPIVPWEDLVEH
jgi:hypothetical protein